MKALLDQHLPAQRRRKPVALWWLWLVMAGGIIGAGGYHLLSAYRRVARPELAPAPSIISATERATDGQQAPPRQEGKGAAVGQSNAARISALRGDELKAATSPCEAGLTVHHGNISADAYRSVFASEDVPDTSSASSVMPSLSPVSFMSGGCPINALPSLFLTGVRVSSEPKPRFTLAAGLPPMARESRLSAWLSAGLSTQPTARTYGGVLGVGAEWAVCRRWGLRIGVAYRHHWFDSARPTPFSTAYLDENDVRSIQPSLAPATGMWLRLARIHVMELPFQVCWKPTSRIRLYGGGSWSTPLAAQVKDQQKALDGSQVLLFSETREADERATRRLPRGECSATAGVGYRLNSRLELNAQLYWRLFLLADRHPPHSLAGAPLLPNRAPHVTPPLEQLSVQVGVVGWPGSLDRRKVARPLAQ